MFDAASGRRIESKHTSNRWPPSVAVDRPRPRPWRFSTYQCCQSRPASRRETPSCLATIPAESFEGGRQMVSSATGYLYWRAEKAIPKMSCRLL